jgi:hypothetical protein
MSISESAQALQDFRSQLEVWGVTTQGLIAIALIAFFFFLLSAREVVGWFLKTSGVRDEVRELRGQIDQLQRSIDAMSGMQEKPEHPVEKISAKGKTGSEAASSRNTFRLDH